jgi:hypothetical protein
MFWGVLAAGLAIAAFDTLWRLLFGCPDFTDSQSGPGGHQTWSLLPPGPGCTTTVRLPGGLVGTHLDPPSWARVLAILAWLGWLITTALLHRALRERTGQPATGHRPT